MMRWANTTRIVQITDDPRIQPSSHDTALSLLVSSIEIGIRRTTNLRFITHLDVVRHASTEAQNASSPLSIPLPNLEHTFPGGAHVRIDSVHVKPDALFGIGYGDDHKFFAVEYDRSTEDVEPTKNLARASWLRVSPGRQVAHSRVLTRPGAIGQGRKDHLSERGMSVPLVLLSQKAAPDPG